MFFLYFRYAAFFGNDSALKDNFRAYFAFCDFPSPPVKIDESMGKVSESKDRAIIGAVGACFCWIFSVYRSHG